MARFLIILAGSAIAVMVFWPYVRRLDPKRMRDNSVPVRKADTIFFALAITMAITLTLSTVLWVMKL